MREPRNYDALRQTEHQVFAGQQFAEAGREVTNQQERGTEPAPELQRDEPNARTALEDHEGNLEAKRAALWEELDGQVKRGQIDRHEQQYQMQRFENSPLEPDRMQRDAAQSQEPDRASARERLEQHMEDRAAGNGRDDEQDNTRKPPEIER